MTYKNIFTGETITLIRSFNQKFNNETLLVVEYKKHNPTYFVKEIKEGIRAIDTKRKGKFQFIKPKYVFDKCYIPINSKSIN